MKILKLLKVWNWLRKLWDKYDDKLIHFATNLTQKIKKAIESDEFIPIVELVKSLTPDTIDLAIDKVVKITYDKIPELAIQLKIIDISHDITDENELIKSVSEALMKNYKGDNWEKFWSSFVQELIYAFADGKLSWSEAGVLGKSYYETNVKGK